MHAIKSYEYSQISVAHSKMASPNSLPLPSSSSASSSSSKKKPVLFSLIVIFSISILLFTISFGSKPLYNTTNRLDNSQQPLDDTIKLPKWYYVIAKEFPGKKIKMGLVNVEENGKHAHQLHRLPGTNSITVPLDKVHEDTKWSNFFPEWIDEHEKWGPPKCPEIPMPPSDEAFRDLDVVVAMAPCDGVGLKEGARDVLRLQVNLVVANLTVKSGWVSPDIHRPVYVVFIGTCGPMREIFRCDDLVMHEGDYLVYKPQLRKLKHKVHMPVGSCQIAPTLAERGLEVWRYFMSVSALQQLNYTVHYQKDAYVTVLHSSEAYVCGAIALAQSIRMTESTRDLVLLADESISSNSIKGLRAAGWKIKRIQRIRSPHAKKNAYNEWNYSKLRVWQLTEYDKVIFIDADLLVLKNMDIFFYYPQLSAVSNKDMLFNSGVMVIEPSLCTFEELMRERFKLKSYNGGDQGFLNEFFTWWHRLPSNLNRLKLFLRPGNEKHEIPSGQYAIHYLGLKPWMCYRDYDCNWDMRDRQIFASDSAHSLWWNVYDAMPKNLQRYCGLTKGMDTRIKKWRGIAKNTNLIDGHWNMSVRDPRQHQIL